MGKPDAGVGYTGTYWPIISLLIGILMGIAFICNGSSDPFGTCAWAPHYTRCEERRGKIAPATG